MHACLFATDLHGHAGRYEKLFAAIERVSPAGVFLGGDLLPHGAHRGAPGQRFVRDVIGERLRRIKRRLGKRYPLVFAIMGNDDCRSEEPAFQDLDDEGLWVYAHQRRYRLERWDIYGYAYVPPTPFRLKDWERYDVSRYVPPGSVSPEEGLRTVPVPENEARFSTIQDDLASLVGDNKTDNAVFMFHSPPHETRLDRAATDGKMVDHVPLDLHVGSVAVRRFIEKRQPLLTLHGHIHESTRITGSWRDRIGHTEMFNGSHHGPELSLVTFDLENPRSATRELL